ncbi:hypothetical protein I5907_04860 [Panacibacter sp. DH6]|uniref:Outer membrane protein beta-barrel domain-containing protein n=1 Tax=Panacibacter microcysteis TaxID=2793269 RepID=A0A931GYE3_9BACT|nr:hypothetical protein [Panacibacter microcysteis]MBG9375552.1 hypothetical protein [Panacibacter microcysteis]
MHPKFTLVLATTLAFATASKAQISKGSAILGGNVSFNHTSSSGSNTNYLAVSPNFGKVYSDNKVAGISLRYAYRSASVDKSLNTHSFGGGFYLAQYKPLGKNFYMFIRESLNINFDREKRQQYNGELYIQDTKTLSAGITINPGVAYDFSRKVQFELLFLNDLISAGYQTSKTTDKLSTGDVSGKQDIFYAGANTLTNLTALNVGVKVFFGR